MTRVYIKNLIHSKKYLLKEYKKISEFEPFLTGKNHFLRRSFYLAKLFSSTDILSEMPRTSMPCKNCGELLRIWPSDMGPNFFKCNENDCWSNSVLILNNGTNRFNCYTCDIDICRECAKGASINYIDNQGERG